MGAAVPGASLQVDAQCDRAGALLAQIAAAVIAAGGEIHPHLVAEECDGELRLLSQDRARSGPDHLLRIPTTVHVPLDGLRFAEGADGIELADDAARLSAAQQEVLHLHLDLYNACDKLAGWKRTSPLEWLDGDAQSAASLIAIKPSFADLIGPTRAGVAAEFIASRAHSLPANRRSVIVPLIELANHHHRGAPVQFGPQAAWLRAARSDGMECFANYGSRRDALDLLVAYGYFASDTCVAHLPPVSVPLPSAGNLRVAATPHWSPHPLDPPKIHRDGPDVVWSHVVCDREDPARTMDAVRLALAGTLARTGGTSAISTDQLIASLLDAADARLAGCIDVLSRNGGVAATRAAEATARNRTIINDVLGAAIS